MRVHYILFINKFKTWRHQMRRWLKRTSSLKTYTYQIPGNDNSLLTNYFGMWESGGLVRVVSFYTQKHAILRTCLKWKIRHLQRIGEINEYCFGWSELYQKREEQMLTSMSKISDCVVMVIFQRKVDEYYSFFHRNFIFNYHYHNHYRATIVVPEENRP